MKKHLVIIILLLFPFVAGAQTLSYGELKRVLAKPDSLTGAKIIIHESAKLEGISARKIDPLANPKVKIFRVRIFFDNTQRARTVAMETATKFTELLPDIPIDVTHENPYFKVTVGQCLTEEEALVIWGRIKNDFEKAFVTREDVPLSALSKPPHIPTPTTPTSPEQTADQTTTEKLPTTNN